MLPLCPQELQQAAWELLQQVAPNDLVQKIVLA